MSIDPTAFPIEFDPRAQRMRGYTAHKGMHFDVPFMSEIAPNLWQGGCETGLILPPEIKHLISLYKWERYKVPHDLDSFLEVTMYDSSQQGPDLDQVLAIAQWVNLCRQTGPVLVHCQAGLNRSSLIVGAALITGERLRPSDVIATIREKRSPACLCNHTFEQMLLAL